MHLYLASYHLSSAPEYFSDSVGENKRAAVIMNASDVFPADHHDEYLQRELDDLDRLGLQGEELDLRSFFDRPAALPEALSHYGAIWATGGNTFVLRRAMRRSGFDRLIRGLLHKGVVYGGYSAGSVVTGPSLRGLELVDNPYDVPDRYDTPPIWEGLGLVNFAIAPHFQSDHPESAVIDNVVAYFERLHVTYKAIEDGAAVVVNGDDVKVVRSH